MILRTGVDLIEIERLRDSISRFGLRFLQRIYTPAELEEIGTNPASLAARFAAKEAVAKALGTGIGVVGWQQIEILRGASRQPDLKLNGVAANMAAEQGLLYWSLSLSHTHTHAIAVVTAAG